MPQDPTNVRLRGNDPEARTGSVRRVPEDDGTAALATDSDGHVVLSEQDVQRIAAAVAAQLLTEQQR